MTVFDQALAEWTKEYHFPKNEKFDQAIKNIVSIAQLEVWNMIEQVLANPSIDCLCRGEWDDGEKGWLVAWSRGGFTGGATIEEAIKSAKQELGL